MKRMRLSNSDSEDSSDGTAEIEVSTGPPDEQVAGSSGQPFSPSATSPSLDIAVPGTSSAEGALSTSRYLEQTRRGVYTIGYLWHLFRQHERSSDINPVLLRFWSRFGNISEQSNGCNVSLISDYRQQVVNSSTSSSENVRSPALEPSSDDESMDIDMNVSAPNPTPEEQDYQSQDELDSATDDTDMSEKESSDTDDEKPPNDRPKRSSDLSREIIDEVNDVIALLDRIRVRNQEKSDDSLLKDFSKSKPSTSQNVAQVMPGPPSQQRRKENKKKRHVRAQEAKRGVISSVERILVPTNKIGRLVGKKGRQIKEIEKKTGTNIKIETRKSNKNVTEVTLRGTAAAIEAADREIRALIRYNKPYDTGDDDVWGRPAGTGGLSIALCVHSAHTIFQILLKKCGQVDRIIRQGI